MCVSVFVFFCLSDMTLTDGGVVGGGSGISHLSLCVWDMSCVDLDCGV